MKITEIKNTKPPFEVYKKKNKEWVRFNTNNKEYDMPADEALDMLLGLGLLFFGICLFVELNKIKK